MDIEATIEDLEAQAYFASIVSIQTLQPAKVILQVNLIERAQTFFLSWPLIGKDFVAGFDTKAIGEKPVWLLIPLTAVALINSYFTEIDVTLLFARDLLQGKLLGSKVAIRTSNNERAISGLLVGVQENFLSLRLPSLQLVHFSFGSLKCLVVEKLNSPTED
jgi:hypothetical protein